LGLKRSADPCSVLQSGSACSFPSTRQSLRRPRTSSPTESLSPWHAGPAPCVPLGARLSPWLANNRHSARYPLLPCIQLWLLNDRNPSALPRSNEIPRRWPSRRMTGAPCARLRPSFVSEDGRRARPVGAIARSVVGSLRSSGHNHPPPPRVGTPGFVAEG